MEINGKKTGSKDSTSNCEITHSQENKPKPLAASWISTLFAKLHARYGHKWTSSYPQGQVLAIALQEWSDGLAGYSGEEIKTGLDSWDGDWPPSLPEFKKACRPPPVRKLACHQPFPAIERKLTKDESAQHVIALRNATNRTSSREESK